MVLKTEYISKIMICVINVHFVNIAKTGLYEKELNKMLATNGLPSIRAPKDVPPEELFGVRAEFQLQTMKSQESVRSAAFGYQGEEREGLFLSFAMGIGSLTNISAEMRSIKGMHEIVRDIEKEHKRSQEIESKMVVVEGKQETKKQYVIATRTLGLVIYTSEARRYAGSVT